MKKLKEIYSAHTNKVSDKWSLYLEVYDRIFDSYRNSPINLLEIGIQNGGSLEIWDKYFPNAIEIIGCDINEKCADLTFESKKISVIVGDACSKDISRQITIISPSFDIIIDDGSHSSSDIIKSFLHYFSQINDGGIFVAEDLHCSYWQEYEGGLFNSKSSISFFKSLADVINYEHWGLDLDPAYIISHILDEYGCAIPTDILSEIHSIEFINSICVVRKRNSSNNKLEKRIVVGEIAAVEPAVMQLNGMSMFCLDQSTSKWNIPFSAQVEDLNDRINELNETLRKRIIDIENLHSELENVLGSRSWRIMWPLRKFSMVLRKLFSKIY
ncbi:MAG: class I SAM-dependent methyltransferase [Lentilitoribacter sp.]